MSKRALHGFFWLAVVILLVSLSDSIADIGANAEAALVIASFFVGWQLVSALSDGDDK